MSTATTDGAIPKKLYAIPAFPPIAGRLMATFAQQNVQTKDIADLIAKEPTFASRVLQIANSAQFAFQFPITNIRHAVVLMGLEQVRNATVTLATVSLYRAALQADELIRCWQHTVACGILAAEIAKACGVFQEEAYTAGILHDIGRLGLLAAYPREYQKTVRDAAERSLDLLDYEREQFGVDHCEAGRWLGERWGLPKEFRIIAGRHHDPPDGASLDLRTVVHMACRFADYLGFDVTKPLKPVELDELLAPIPEARRLRLIRDVDRLRRMVQEHLGDYGAALAATEEPNPEQAEEVSWPEEFPVCLPEAGGSETSRGWITVAAWVAVLVAALAMWMLYK